MFLADLYIELTWRRIWKSNLNLPSSDIDESAMKGLYYHCWTPKCRSTTCVCVQKMSATLPLWDIAYYRNKLFHPIVLFLLAHPLCVTISVSFWNSRYLSFLSGTLSCEQKLGKVHKFIFFVLEPGAPTQLQGCIFFRLLVYSYL